MRVLQEDFRHAPAATSPMRNILLAVLLSFSARLLLAQSPEMQQSQVARLRADLEFLTSDVLAGRLSLTPQADISARYIAAAFQRSGLQPANGNSYLQEFPLVSYRTDAKARALVLLRGGKIQAFRSGTDFSGGFYRDIDIKAPLLFAGYGITAPEYGYDDYAHLDARGKIVIIFDHEPQEDNPQSIFNGTGNTLHAGRWTKLANARLHGAIGVLIASEPVRNHPALLETVRNSGQPQAGLRGSAPPQMLDDSAQIPGFSISQATLDALLAPMHRAPADIQRAIDSNLKPQSESLEDTIVEMRSNNAEQSRGISLNAVGLLEGSDPTLKSETILITAHYDHLGVQNGHLYPGANDNAPVVSPSWSSRVVSHKPTSVLSGACCLSSSARKKSQCSALSTTRLTRYVRSRPLVLLSIST